MTDRKQIPGLPEATEISPNDFFVKRNSDTGTDEKAAASLVASASLELGEVATSTGVQPVAEALDQRVIYVDTVADLQALDAGSAPVGSVVVTSGWGSVGDGGGATYVKTDSPPVEFVGENLFADIRYENEDAWSLGTGWSFDTSSGVMSASESGLGSAFREIGLGHLWLIEGREYEVKFKISNRMSGSVSWRAFGLDPLESIQSGDPKSENGEFTERFVASSGIQTFGFASRAGDTSLDVSDFSISPVVKLDQAVIESSDGSQWVYSDNEIHPEALGAVSNNLDESTAAFQQALALQQSKNKLICIGKGVFECGPLHRLGRTYIVGSGLSSAMQGPGLGPDVSTGTNIRFISAKDGDYWLTWNGTPETYSYFEGFKVIGSGQNNSNNQGAFRLPASGVQSNRSTQFINMAVEMFNGYALWLPYTIGFIWQGGYIRRCGERGVSGGGMYFTRAEELTKAETFAGISAQLNPQDIITCHYGIKVEDGGNLTIVTMSDVIGQFNYCCVHAPNSTRWRVENCYMEFNQDVAMRLRWGWEFGNRKHDDGEGGGDIVWNEPPRIVVDEEGISSAIVRNGAFRMLREEDSPDKVGPSLYTGVDSPEGAELAAPGSIFMRVTTSNVPKAYVKRTGSSVDTGWSQLLMGHSTSTSARPSGLGSPDRGYLLFDITLNQPIWWDGNGWVDAMGNSV